MESIFEAIWHWYVNVFWHTDGFWGIVLAILGVFVFFLAIILIYYAFGILLHGIIGAVSITIIGVVLCLLGLIEWRTANELYVYGFYIGLAIGIIRLFIDHNGFSSIFDGTENSETKSFEGKTFTGSDENGYPITLKQSFKNNDSYYYNPDNGDLYERDASGNFHRR